MVRAFRACVAYTTLGLLAVAGASSPVHADPVKCQKTVVKQLAKLKKTYLKLHEKCWDAVNVGKISGDCLDAKSGLKLSGAVLKVREKVAKDCLLAELTGSLGFPSDCQYATPASGLESTCAALPVSDASELAQCLVCWKTAELSEYVAVVYASHAVDQCGGDLGALSPDCAPLDCSTPLPVQRDLGDNAEEDCQKALGKAAVKYLVAREKILEKCALKGGTSGGCIGGGFDPKVPLALAKADFKRGDFIAKKCGNRAPVADPPFCCKTMGNMCVAAADRDDCVMNQGGQVQEDKTCNAGSCDPVGGPNKPLTWWEACPEAGGSCGGALVDIGDVSDCIGVAADAAVDELLCLQFRGNGGADWPCPAD